MQIQSLSQIVQKQICFALQIDHVFRICQHLTKSWQNYKNSLNVVKILLNLDNVCKLFWEFLQKHFKCWQFLKTPGRGGVGWSASHCVDRVNISSLRRAASRNLQSALRRCRIIKVLAKFWQPYQSFDKACQNSEKSGHMSVTKYAEWSKLWQSFDQTYQSFTDCGRILTNLDNCLTTDAELSKCCQSFDKTIKVLNMFVIFPTTLNKCLTNYTEFPKFWTYGLGGTRSVWQN